MTDSITTHTVVPIATEDDARATCDALEDAVEEIETLTVVHVIEKTEGYPDKAPFEARREQAERIFSIVEERFPDGPAIRRELRYGTDVVDEVVAAAADVDATAIGFRPRPGGRLRRLLSGSDSYRLITESERPVVVFSRLGSQTT
ncbi:universal stress protein [Haloterrigena sp. SYSU A558-1]|uniref:Universal stress protein n=1 Tax=Haloterrigena gelatinilytica TaxID=2741724 RepID=A0A8J8GNH4_9EURY|nr:universal stress protein [Haloterrigena gelatinilytica]NUB92370.1 universal stress protein [Haloterrigena gelatinilytica]NUC71804.1 universal stress protein [Haloterrigena gelatinilytica]